MFEKFGNFNSSEEINSAAKGQLEKGDTDAIFALAAENGIDREEAEDYIDGVVTELTNPLIAALGKLKVEEEDLKPHGIMKDWIGYIRTRCSENEEIAKGVREKDKSLKGCISELLKWSFKNQQEVDKDILKEAGVNGRVSLGIPEMGTAFKIITDYYGKEK